MGPAVLVGVKLPQIIDEYIRASNAHDVKAILACLADDAVVHDEKQEFRGKEIIKDWIATTIEKYKFHFKPLSVRGGDVEPIVFVEVSGTFPGSPVTLGYRFAIANDQIASLTID